MLHLGIHKIQGESMLPVFKHDDFVVSFSCCNSHYKINDVVIVQHPTLGKIVKRIISIEKKSVMLVGDNLQQSTSTQSIGPQPLSHIQGRVIWHISAKPSLT
jgi:phage repressor protein C with HTH and peptisase S24 domain